MEIVQAIVIKHHKTYYILELYIIFIYIYIYIYISFNAICLQEGNHRWSDNHLSEGPEAAHKKPREDRLRYRLCCSYWYEIMPPKKCPHSGTAMCSANEG